MGGTKVWVRVGGPAYPQQVPGPLANTPQLSSLVAIAILLFSLSRRCYPLLNINFP